MAMMKFVLRLYLYFALLGLRKLAVYTITYGFVIYILIAHGIFGLSMPRWEVCAWAGVTLVWQFNYRQQYRAARLWEKTSNTWRNVAEAYKSMLPMEMTNDGFNYDPSSHPNGQASRASGFLRNVRHDRRRDKWFRR